MRALVLDRSNSLLGFGSRVRRGPARERGLRSLRSVRLGAGLAGRLVLSARGDEAHAIALVLKRGPERLPTAVHALRLAGRQRHQVRRLVQVDEPAPPRKADGVADARVSDGEVGVYNAVASG